MIITQHDNCLLDVKLIESGIPGIKTLELHRQFPEAQRPHWQRITQINADKYVLWQLAYFLHSTVK